MHYSLEDQGSIDLERMAIQQEAMMHKAILKGIKIQGATMRFDGAQHSLSPRHASSAERTRLNSLSTQAHKHQIRRYVCASGDGAHSLLIDLFIWHYQEKYFSRLQPKCVLRLDVKQIEKAKGIVAILKGNVDPANATKNAASMWKNKSKSGFKARAVYRIADSGGLGENENAQGSTEPLQNDPQDSRIDVDTHEDSKEEANHMSEPHIPVEGTGDRIKSPPALLHKWKTRIKNIGVVKRLTKDGTPDIDKQENDGSIKNEVHDVLADENLAVYIQNICNVYKHIDTGPKGLEIAAARRSMVLLTDSPLMTFWSLGVLVLVVFYAVAVPIRVAWEPKLSLPATYFDYVSDVVFLFDIVVNFRTAFNEKGVIIIDPKRITRKYLTSWFFIDFAASVPIGWFMNEDNSASKANKLIRLLRILKLARIFRIGRYFYRFKQLFQLNPSIVRFMKGAGGLFFVWHLVGCSYWYIVHQSIYESFEVCDKEVYSFSVNELVTVPSRCWKNACHWSGTCRDEYEDEELFDLIPNEYHLPDTWLPNPNMASMSLYNQYWFAYFWAVEVTTGFGNDVTPKTILEVVFTIINAVAGLTILAIIIGAASSALSNIDSVKAQHKERLDHVSDNLRHWNVPLFFQTILKDFYEHTWSNPNDSTRVLRDLPDTLHMRLRIIIYQDLVNKVPLFKTLATSQFVEVCLLHFHLIVLIPFSFISTTLAHMLLHFLRPLELSNCCCVCR
jgi:hypothetical protein